MFVTVPHASRCASSYVHHFHILNLVNFISFHLKFTKFERSFIPDAGQQTQFGIVSFQ